MPTATRGFRCWLKSKPVIIALGVIALLGVLYLLFGPSVISRINRRRLQRMNVLLITLDTLRADHLSCYDPGRVETPNLDRLAEEGVLFEQCVSQTPLTLPAHTSILSGTYPLFHQVRDNGGFVVPQDLTLISELIRQNKITTSAFIAAYVLHSKWGINQGFDFFSDKFDLSKYQTFSLGEVQKRAPEVLRDSRSWLEKNSGHRFFSWIHLYDPHTPYDPPAPFSELYREHPYRGEVAYLDHELGKFFDFLKQKKLWKNTLIIVTGDHGEMLGEHQEKTHGYFIYEASVRVPLIVHAPFAFPVKRVKELVEHVDLAPTILEAMGIDRPASIQGRSLLDLLFGGSGRGFDRAYTETYYPRLHFGWSELKGFYRHDLKFIQAPLDELYDVRADGRESENLNLKKSFDKKKLQDELELFIREKSRHALAPVDFGKNDRDALEKLAALGYITAFVDTSGKTDLVDPKQKIGVYMSLSEARQLKAESKIDEAIALVKRILAEDPGIVDARLFLGNLYLGQKKHREALAVFLRVLEQRPDYYVAMINIVACYKMLGDWEKVKAVLTDYMKVFPRDSSFNFEMGNVFYFQKNFDKALTFFFTAVEIDTNNTNAMRRIGEVYFLKKEMAKATEWFTRALKANIDLRRTYFDLALLEEEKNNSDKAMEYYRLELEADPHNYKAAFNLAELLRRRGRDDEAIQYYRQSIDNSRNFNIPYFMVAKYNLDRRRDLEEAIRLCEEGIKILPEDKYTAFGNYVLSDIYSLLNQPARSAFFFRRGEELMKRFR